ncbi:MAG: NAD(P)H-dependent oxidoreductase [Bacteroidota bacterium]
MVQSEIHIAIIIGSVREGRQTDKIAYYLHNQLSLQVDTQAQLWDLAEEPLPILTQKWRKIESPPTVFPRMSNFLDQADGIIFCSPEYHGSYTGVLKNAVDHFWNEFKRKPIGVVSTGSGYYGGLNASSEMQQLILSLGAFPMPKKLLVPNVQRAFDPNGNPIEEVLKKNVQEFIEEFLWFVKALKHATHPIPVEL